jgi:hypothetical protein
MIANRSRKGQTASAPAHLSVSTPLALCPLRSSFRYVSSLLLARAGHENAVLGLCATAPSDRASERLVSRDDGRERRLASATQLLSKPAIGCAGFDSPCVEKTMRILLETTKC